MLLCLLYALEASDCFFENLIAASGYPVLIDVETRRLEGLLAKRGK